LLPITNLLMKRIRYFLRSFKAHHKIPLAQLSENTETKLEDLITVCANCHRVLR